MHEANRSFSRTSFLPLLSSVVALQFPVACPASAAPESHAPIEAERLVGEVKIDGILDEAAWGRPHNNGLVQNDPDNGVPPLHLTDWWIAYDDEALYAAFRLHDTSPDSIETAVARRDVYLNTDRVELELDTFNDGRNGYLFRVTAGGAIADATLYNDGWGDHSWDGVWESAARVDEQGWTCEIRIPLSQLRFADSPSQTWGINVSRYIKRNQERDDLFHRPRNDSGYISRFPDLTGLDDLEPQSSRELLVYGAAKGEYLAADEGNPFDDGSEHGGSVGADLRWGLTNSITLNATLNPDFGQVEVDPAVVNLSDFEVFFPERRPFFVQDSNVFRFGRDGTNNNWGFNWMDPIPFYSRRVGRSPQLSPEQSYDFGDTPDATTILGAGKVTGTMGNTSIGVLTAMTAEEHHSLASGNTISEELAEPLTNYTVMRGTRSFGESTRALGFMATSTLRDLSNANAEASLVRGAYSMGVDGWTYLDEGQRWALKGYAGGSYVEGSEDAIASTQLRSTRYFQRPDADHLDYDPERTNLSGWASRVMLNKEKGDYRLNTAVGAVSPGYEINDVGFQNRADHVNSHMAVGRRWSEPKGIFRQANLDVGTYSSWDFGGTRSGGGTGMFYWTQFKNYWSVNGSFFYNPPAQDVRATRGGPTMRSPVNREFSVSVNGDRRMMIRPGAWFGAGDNTAGGSNVYGGIEIEFRPSAALTFSIEPGFSWENDDAQYVSTVGDPVSATYGNRYIFSDLDYRQLDLGLRLDWAFSPKLTLQTYVQPLIAVGKYETLKEFTDPGGYAFKVYGQDGGSTLDYDEANDVYNIDPGDGGASFSLGNPDFNFKSLRLNMVLRWEYSPGSTFYLVWTRDKTNFDNPGDLDPGRDMRSLMDAEGNDIVMVKLTRFLGI
jgi:hypothetical protein